jgi:hypothetical protein
LGRDKKPPHFPGDISLRCLVGFEPFTALLIYSLFQHTVNPPILLLGWLNKWICLLQNGAGPGASCVVLERL